VLEWLIGLLSIGKNRRILHLVEPWFILSMIVRLKMRDEQALLLVPLRLRALSYLVWATSDRAAVQTSERAVFPGFAVMVRTSRTKLSQGSEPVWTDRSKLTELQGLQREDNVA
jgi:hypothetical protein